MQQSAAISYVILIPQTQSRLTPGGAGGTALGEFHKGSKGVPNEKTRPKQVGLLKLILPGTDRNYDELYLYSDAERIFEFLAGQKSYDFITSS